MQKYFVAISAMCMFHSILLAFVPKGTIRKIADVVGGMLVVLVIMSPIVKLDAFSISNAVSQYALKLGALENDVEIGSRELMSQVIREKCEAYILDKATMLGLQLKIEVTMKEEVEIPYPVSVKLIGRWTNDEQRTLSRYISENLGISDNEQEWIWM